ncbi:uncharacterized protein Z518_09181 [Rhinocladiella mackenziei CBS 650.93]|uniref:Cytochrome P450 monooxygenase n=1 Tax=Rhinocladiella mackenziei CBS 650.93 TaxID=1442369 RepID=A0A0D2IY15_9EURO|nr:uncharacterized protein Z518_09181 [Rhinocladiella mackenziei CBS 650.93]KIX01455.1 hypothetical protein Z518_09181 [Rhinocladiella mackenziei CBS 650.93]
MTLSVPTPLILFSSAFVESWLLMSFCSPNWPKHSWTLLLFALTAANFTLWLVYKAGIYPYWISPLRHLPRPKGTIPFIGPGLTVLQKPMGKYHLKLMKEVPNEGTIYFRGIFNLEFLMLTNAKTLADVLVGHPYDFQKPEKGRTYLNRILGMGLVVAEGDVHRHQRRHVLPAFGFRYIKRLYPTFWSKAVALTRSIVNEMNSDCLLANVDKPGTATVDLNQWAMKVTLDAIGIAGLGRDFDSLRNSHDELARSYDEILNPTLEAKVLFTLNMIGGPWASKLLLSADRRLTNATTRLRHLCRNFLHEKRESMKQDEASIDLLSHLIRSNDFSDDELVDQLLTFLAAGHETTSATFSWIAYLLATNPSIQSRLRNEIRSHIPTDFVHKPHFDLATTLEALPLLNGVCNETLRLYPTVPLTARTATRDTTIVDQPIAKGQTVLIVPWAINRSPDHWGPTAEEFRPDRWIDADTGKTNNTGGATTNYSIMTFLHGPRSCIGQGFAKAELRTLTAVLVSAFEMEMARPNERPVPAGVITTKPAGGMHLRLKSVGHW